MGNYARRASTTCIILAVFLAGCGTSGTAGTFDLDGRTCAGQVGQNATEVAFHRDAGGQLLGNFQRATGYRPVVHDADGTPHIDKVSTNPFPNIPIREKGSRLEYEVGWFQYRSEVVGNGRRINGTSYNISHVAGGGTVAFSIECGPTTKEPPKGAASK